MSVFELIKALIERLRAAAKAVIARIEEQRAENERLAAENGQLHTLVDDLTKEVETLEAAAQTPFTPSGN